MIYMAGVYALSVSLAACMRWCERVVTGKWRVCVLEVTEAGGLEHACGLKASDTCNGVCV
jgi:hypothetical protein